MYITIYIYFILFPFFLLITRSKGMLFFIHFLIIFESAFLTVRITFFLWRILDSCIYSREIFNTRKYIHTFIFTSYHMLKRDLIIATTYGHGVWESCANLRMYMLWIHVYVLQSLNMPAAQVANSGQRVWESCANLRMYMLCIHIYILQSLNIPAAGR